MIRKVHRIRRIIVGIALAASVASWAAQPVPAFDGRSPDVVDAGRQPNAGSLIDFRSPDVVDAGRQPNAGSLIDFRSPDVVDAGRQPNAGSLIDFRSPDVVDAAHPLARNTPVGTPVVLSSDRFNWGDFGLGIALASMLLLAAVAGGALVARKRRGEGVGPATT